MCVCVDQIGGKAREKTVFMEALKKASGNSGGYVWIANICVKCG